MIVVRRAAVLGISGKRPERSRRNKEFELTRLAMLGLAIFSAPVASVVGMISE
jgi:hypothetical protein